MALLSYRERVESTGHVYVWRARSVRVGGFAWLTGVLGLPAHGPNQAIGLVRALSGSGSGWEMKWHESKPQVSGRERYGQAHFCRLGHGRRGTAEENAANEKFTTPFRRGLENQTAWGRRQQCAAGVNARTRRPQTLATGRLSGSVGVRDGLDQNSGGLVACAGPES